MQEQSKDGSTYYRVQIVGRESRGSKFTTSSTPNGGRVVTLSSDTYAAAKSAAAAALAGHKKPA